MDRAIIVRLVKMESESEIATFGLKMMMKCDLDLFLNRFMWEESKVDFVTEFVTFGKILSFYEVRKNNFLQWGISKNILLNHYSPSFLGQELLQIILLLDRYRFHYDLVIDG